MVGPAGIFGDGGESAFDLVIFDCDGVLVDSEAISAATLADNLSALGLATSIDYVMEHYLGRSFVAVAADYRERMGKSLPDDFADRWHRDLFAAFRRDLKPMQGVVPLLEALKTPKCVASSSAPVRLALTLEVTRLAAIFGPHVFDASMVAHGKPAPDLFLFCAARMGAEPARTLVIEDSAMGVTAAARAGMTVWGFIGGAHHNARDAAGMLRRAGASRILASMAELVIA
jgi:HAD superfamily hydrolase (TIGR01509 family)